VHSRRGPNGNAHKSFQHGGPFAVHPPRMLGNWPGGPQPTRNNPAEGPSPRECRRGTAFDVWKPIQSLTGYKELPLKQPEHTRHPADHGHRCTEMQTGIRNITRIAPYTQFGVHGNWLAYIFTFAEITIPTQGLTDIISKLFGIAGMWF